MSGAVLISRFLGLAREQVFAWFFGAGMASDAYLVAFRIPNLLRDLFAEGALSSAFVTVFSRTDDPARSRQLARNVLTAISLVVGLVCVGIFFFAPEIVAWMVPDFAGVPGKLELTSRLTAVLAPFLLFASSAALAMGILNSLGSFFIPSLGSAAFNAGNIVIGGGLAWYLRDQGMEQAIWGFAIGSLVGGFLQWAVQWPALKARGYPPLAGVSGTVNPARWGEAFRDPALRKIVTLMAPSILAVAAVQVNVFISTLFASSMPQGSVSWLNFAFRLIHFPMGVFGVALSAAALPSFARLLRDRKIGEFEATLQSALSYTWLLAIGSAAGLVAFRTPLVALLYEYGRFGTYDTYQTALALAAYAIALPALNSTKIFVQVYYGLDKVWIPSTVSVLLIACFYALASWGAGRLGHVGLALATSATSVLNAVILGALLRARGHRLMNRSTWRTLIASIVGGVMLLTIEVSGAADWLLSTREAVGHWGYAVLCLTAVGLGAALYASVLIVLSPEARALAGKVAARFGKGKRRS